jgi:Lon protease-like protein
VVPAALQVGVIANVRGVQALEDGTLEIEYEGSRRFQILSMVEQEPYMVGHTSLARPLGRATATYCNTPPVKCVVAFRLRT